jgi:hypothetical protein
MTFTSHKLTSCVEAIEAINVTRRIKKELSRTTCNGEIDGILKMEGSEN